jgi:hypothetical protein
MPLSWRATCNPLPTSQEWSRIPGSLRAVYGQALARISEPALAAPSRSRPDDPLAIVTETFEDLVLPRRR